MNSFQSDIVHLGKIQLPPFQGVRILMMPYKLECPQHTLPASLDPWLPTVIELGRHSPAQIGTAYLTIDEAIVEEGETHRRPGYHVDGIAPDGMSAASWAASPSTVPARTKPSPQRGPRPLISPPPRSEPPARRKRSNPNERDTPSKRKRRRNGGMLLLASHLGCRGWNQTFIGRPGPDGDCEHLAAQCDPKDAILMRGGHAYWVGHLGVHQALPMVERTRRQVIRISMPSDAPWYEGCTPNPFGLQPDGPIHPRREAFMAHRK